MSASPERLESIDALRGIAFLGVLLVHTGQSVPDFFGKQQTAAGAFDVPLFFIASAFTLLASPHDRRTQELSPTLSFFIRRFPESSRCCELQRMHPSRISQRSRWLKSWSRDCQCICPRLASP